MNILKAIGLGVAFTVALVGLIAFLFWIVIITNGIAYIVFVALLIVVIMSMAAYALFFD